MSNWQSLRAWMFGLFIPCACNLLTKQFDFKDQESLQCQQYATVSRRTSTCTAIGRNNENMTTHEKSNTTLTQKDKDQHSVITALNFKSELPMHYNVCNQKKDQAKTWNINDFLSLNATAL